MPRRCFCCCFGCGVPDVYVPAVPGKLPNFRVRPGQKPASVSGAPVLPTAEGTTTKKDVLLYRDTDGWCVCLHAAMPCALCPQVV